MPLLAFALARNQFKQLRVGSQDATDGNQRVAEQWRALSPEQRAMFEERAKEMQKARVELMSQPLRAQESHDSLTKGQRQRLNNSRLDPTLQQVSGHAAWGAGLGLHDHISALRPDLVWNVECRQEFAAAFQGIFSFDSNIAANGNLPTFQQPCVSTGGGICKQHRLFPWVETLVKELDASIVEAQLREQLVLLHVQACTVEDMLQDAWAVIGCVSLRPLVHCVLSLMPAGAQNLALAVENGNPKIGTTHRMFLSLLRQFEASGQSAPEFGAEAGCNLTMPIVSQLTTFGILSLQVTMYAANVLTFECKDSHLLVQYPDPDPGADPKSGSTKSVRIQKCMVGSRIAGRIQICQKAH